jgi:hypothetical protein
VGFDPLRNARALGGCGRLGRGFDDPSSTERESVALADRGTGTCCAFRHRDLAVRVDGLSCSRGNYDWQRDVLAKHAGRHAALGLDLNAHHRTEANVLERFGVALIVSPLHCPHSPGWPPLQRS